MITTHLFTNQLFILYWFNNIHKQGKELQKKYYFLLLIKTNSILKPLIYLIKYTLHPPQKKLKQAKIPYISSK